MQPVTENQLLTERFADARRRVDRAATEAGRDPGDVRILLATKTVDPERILQAIAAGADLIGENRVQETLAKADAVAGLCENHFIGHLQSNKINQLLPHITCLQTLDSAELAQRLDARLAVLDRTLDVLVQVNVSSEPTKSGIRPEEAAELVAAVAGLPRLTLRGYMTIGLNSPDIAAVRAGYAALRTLRDELRAQPGAEQADQLSMGMSGDFEAAVAEGATIVRLGSVVFGGRPPLA